MNNTSIRTPEGAKNILEYNLKTLYYLPDKYKYLKQMLTKGDIRKELYKIYHYIMNIEPIIYEQKYVWYLDNGTLKNKIKIAHSTGTCSRHFNYLCSLGVLRKLSQTEENMIGINREFLLETGNKRPMNVITVYKYTDSQLENIEKRAKQLFNDGVTPGNISNIRLRAYTNQSIAGEVFFANSEDALEKKEEEYIELFALISKECLEYGYTTKARIYSKIRFSRFETDKLFKIYSKRLWEEFKYSPPTKEIAQDYNLKNKKWIIQKREK